VRCLSIVYKKLSEKTLQGKHEAGTRRRGELVGTLWLPLPGLRAAVSGNIIAWLADPRAALRDRAGCRGCVAVGEAVPV
jgi:hypothetical protein